MSGKSENDLINSSSVILAVDPGKSGAVCRLGGGKLEVRRDFKCLQDIARAIRDLSAGVTHAVMEFVHAMPGEGVCSVWAFGRAAGTADGAFALALPALDVEEIPPQTWQRFYRERFNHPFEIVKGRKKWLKEFDSRELAGQIFPSYLPLLKRKLDHNTADSMLIAAYTLLRN